MKKFNVLTVVLVQAALLTACGGPQQLPMQASMPGSAIGAGTGYADPGYGAGTGYTDPSYGAGTGYSDPYGAGTGTGYNDPYGTGAGYGTGTGYNDPYGTGTGTGYNDPYGTGAGYGTGVGAGYGTGVGTGYGQPGYGAVDPVTGQPMMNPAVSQGIIDKIQAAGGYRSSKADNAVREALSGISIQQSMSQAPLEHRAMIIKTLLDGWAGDDDRNFAQQVWNTILPQDQQRLLSSDNELSKLVNDKLIKGKSNGIGAIFSEVGKLVGLKK